MAAQALSCRERCAAGGLKQSMKPFTLHNATGACSDASRDGLQKRKGRRTTCDATQQRARAEVRLIKEGAWGDASRCLHKPLPPHRPRARGQPDGGPRSWGEGCARAGGKAPYLLPGAVKERTARRPARRSLFSSRRLLTSSSSSDPIPASTPGGRAPAAGWGHSASSGSGSSRMPKSMSSRSSRSAVHLGRRTSAPAGARQALAFRIGADGLVASCTCVCGGKPRGKSAGMLHTTCTTNIADRAAWQEPTVND